MNPPVEAPASSAIAPRTSMAKRSRAASSFSPPRPTKRGGGPETTIGSAGSTSRAARAATVPLTSTRPASISAAAWLRLAARWRRTSSASSRLPGAQALSCPFWPAAFLAGPAFLVDAAFLAGPAPSWWLPPSWLAAAALLAGAAFWAAARLPGLAASLRWWPPSSGRSPFWAGHGALAGPTPRSWPSGGVRARPAPSWWPRRSTKAARRSRPGWC